MSIDKPASYNSVLRKCALLLTFTVLAASAGKAQDIPFTLEKGLIVVKAKIFRDIPVDAVIATGNASSAVNLDFVLRNKYTPGYTNDRKNEPVIFVDVLKIAIGDQSPGSLRMMASSLADAGTRTGREIALLLGADFFKGKILQIDFKNRVIRFLKVPPLDYATAFSQPPVSTFVFRMEQESQSFLGQTVTLPVVREASINGSKVRSLLETYVPYPITVSPSAIKEFSLGQMPPKGTMQSGNLKSFSLAGLDIPDIPARFVGKGAGFDTDVSDYGAIIGVAVLQNYKATFDWKEKVVVLERAR